MLDQFKQKSRTWIDSLVDTIKRSSAPGMREDLRQGIDIYQNPPEGFKQKVAETAEKVLPQQALTGIDKWDKLYQKSKWMENTPIPATAMLGATVSPLSEVGRIGPAYFFKDKDTKFLRNVLHNRAMDRPPTIKEADKIKQLFETIVPVNPETKALITPDEMLDALSAFLPKRDFIPRIRPTTSNTNQSSTWKKGDAGLFAGRTSSR